MTERKRDREKEKKRNIQLLYKPTSSSSYLSRAVLRLVLTCNSSLVDWWSSWKPLSCDRRWSNCVSVLSISLHCPWISCRPSRWWSSTIWGGEKLNNSLFLTVPFLLPSWNFVSIATDPIVIPRLRPLQAKTISPLSRQPNQVEVSEATRLLLGTI